MIDLKTLKDIVSWTCECNCVTFDREVCRSCGKSSPKYGEVDWESLRQEAIKHIKHHAKNGECQIKTNLIGRKYYCPRCRWVKMFFNITEEELK